MRGLVRVARDSADNTRPSQSRRPYFERFHVPAGEYEIEQAVIQTQPWQRRRWKIREPDYGWEVCDRSANLAADSR